MEKVKIKCCCLYFQSNLHLSREIQGLKAQLAEMKNMIKLNFDLSLDIQRAVRQEVAAGIAMAAGMFNNDYNSDMSCSFIQPVHHHYCIKGWSVGHRKETHIEKQLLLGIVSFPIKILCDH